MTTRIKILIMTRSFAIKGFFIRHDLENLLGYMTLVHRLYPLITSQHTLASGDNWGTSVLTSRRGNLIKA